MVELQVPDLKWVGRLGDEEGFLKSQPYYKRQPNPGRVAQLIRAWSGYARLQV